jgi:hypothetical protein
LSVAARPAKVTAGSNRSGSPVARATSPIWSAASTFTANTRACLMAAHVLELWAKHTITCGGSSVSEVKAVTVTPKSRSDVEVMTTDTPVANCARGAERVWLDGGAGSDVPVAHGRASVSAWRATPGPGTSGTFVFIHRSCCSTMSNDSSG